MFRMLAAVLAMPLVAATVGAQDTRPTVAVLAFDNNSIGKDAADYDGIGKGIAELLVTDIAGRSDVRVIERARVQALLDERDLTKAGSIDDETAIEIGKLLGVRHMVTGGFMNTGRQMVLTARTIEVETGKISNPQRVQLASDGDVLALIGNLSSRLATSMQLPAIERRTGDAGQQGARRIEGRVLAQDARGATIGTAAPPKPAQPAKLDLRTALLYSKALEAQDAGDRTKAVELYNQVLDRFPNLENARANRDRLQASGN